MGHVILLSERAQARLSRPRDPLPEGGATISLFLGVRYERWGTEHGTLVHGALGPEALKHEALKHEALKHETLKQEALEHEALAVTAADASFVA